MRSLVVVENLKHWPLDVPGTEVILAREYVTRGEYTDLRHARVFNLCRSYAYQSVGYYVSLLAAARGHRPLPSITTVRDLRTSAIVRIVSDDIDALLERSLGRLTSDRFSLSIYFGRNLARRHDPLARALFNRDRLRQVYGDLCRCLRDGRLFQPLEPIPELP